MSTIHTIRDNLVRTIEGKEKYLAECQLARQSEDAHVRMMAYSIVKMLELNIQELKVILNDVNTACSEFSLMGWQINPERMSN